MVPQLRCPTKGFNVSTPFGAKGERWKSFHTGVDFPCPLGTPVMSAWVGIISKAHNAGDGFGFYVRLEHWWRGVGFRTYYAHLSDCSVKPGQEVDIGKPIGLSGDSGNVTGPHLHFGVKVYDLATEEWKWIEPKFFTEEPKNE